MMKVNLDINNRDKIVEFHYRKVKGSIVIRCINDDTGEIFETTILNDLDLGEHDIKPSYIKGYELVDCCEVFEDDINDIELNIDKKDIEEEDEENIEEEEIELSNEDRLNSIRDFLKDLEEI
mgnify:FL=1